MVPDVSSATLTSSKLHKDHITAHKISLMVLVKEFCIVKIKARSLQLDENSWVHTDQQNRNMAISFLKLIQNPDTNLTLLCKIMEPILHPKTYEAFIDRLKHLRKNGIQTIMDYIQTLESLLTESNHGSPPVVHKSSVIGLFIRRMLLAFDKLPFCHITKLCDVFNTYYDNAFSPVDENEKSMDDIDEDDDLKKEDEPKVFASQKQAEFFIAQQTALLQINEKEALTPKELQKKIWELVNGNPSLTEAYYLSFLNNLRVKEYCGAVENMYHHFDKNSSLPHDCKTSTTATDELNRSYRYAALNLAILHARFGHRAEAMSALKEAIMVAQEVNDNICLQHALTWLYRLSKDNAENLIERSVSKSAELNLWYLSSIGIQALTQLKCITTGTPASVFEMVMKGDVLNCQHSMTEVMGTAYAQRSALWTHYGNSSMADLTSELLLYLNTSDPVRGSVYHIGEGTCLALRNLASSLALNGNMEMAPMILSLAKKLFPIHSEHGHIWKVCELILNFEKALYTGCVFEAERSIEGIAAFDIDEAFYRTALLNVSIGNLTKATLIVKKLVSKFEDKDTSPHFRVRVLLLKAMLYCQTSNFHMAIPPLMMGMEICKSHHLFYLKALCVLWAAYIQLMLKLPNKAIQMLDDVLLTFLSHGTAFDKGCCFLLYSKCIAVAIGEEEQDNETKRKALLSAISMTEKAIQHFSKVNALHRTKYTYHWQSQLYNELGLIAERNRIAHIFKILHVQHPSANTSVLLIP